MNSKRDQSEQDRILEYISTQLQNGNTESVLESFKFITQQNSELESSLHKISNSVRNIKQASDQLNHKLIQLQQRNNHSAAIKEIIGINKQYINHPSTNVINKYFPQNIGSSPPKSDTLVNGNNYNVSRRLINAENSETKSDNSDYSQSITIVSNTNKHHHRTNTTPEMMTQINREQSAEMSEENSILSKHGSPQDIVNKLESGDKLLALIQKSDHKGVSKHKIVKYLEKKGVSHLKIMNAYAQYFRQNNLYEIVFSNKPFGFQIKDINGMNAVVTSTQNNRIRVGSTLYEINGKRVNGKKYPKIVHLLQMQKCPFYVIFKHESVRNDAIESSVSSIMASIKEVPPSTPIDWEHVGQILLDNKFLPSSRLINQALDQLENFCNEEDLDENNWRDELCKTWSLLEDRGNILWQILYASLRYSEPERRWFYDLMLHSYFKLKDMKSDNIAVICMKILRDMQVRDIDFVKVKEILILHKIEGTSFENEIKNANEFAQLFESVPNCNSSVWKRVYYGLIAWATNEHTRIAHEIHQKKYKNKLLSQRSVYDNEHNEITVFDDLTKQSIRHDFDYENTVEKKRWVLYRHNLANVFRFFAGWHASHMSKKELKSLLHILEIKKFLNVKTNHLLQDEKISMDQFIKYLCNEHINSRARDIHAHVVTRAEWTMLLSAFKFLEEMDSDKNRRGVVEYCDFQKFGKDLALNNSETKSLFKKIDKNKRGMISIDAVFEWFKKMLLQKSAKKKQNRRPKRKSVSKSDMVFNDVKRVNVGVEMDEMESESSDETNETNNLSNTSESIERYKHSKFNLTKTYSK